MKIAIIGIGLYGAYIADKLSENTKIYTGKQKPKILKIIKNILNKNSSEKEFYGSWKIVNKNKKKILQR